MSATSIRGLIANDAYAITFQTMGQYRTALLRAIDAAPQPQGGALTDEQIREVAVDYCRFVFPGVYSIREFDCEEDFFNCVRAIVAQSAPSAPQQAGDGLTREQLAVFRDVTDDLECELQTRYKGYPDNDRRRVRDFAVVQRARAILAAPRQPGEMGAANDAELDALYEAMCWARDDGLPGTYEHLKAIYDRSAASAQQDAHCQCAACAAGTIHASDCAVHNAPAYPNGPCDCGATTAQQDEREACPECGNPQCFFCYAGAPCGEDAAARKAKEKRAFETWAFKSEKVGKRKTFDLISAEAGWMARASHAIGADEHHIIGAFLERTGQYVTNDASREAAIIGAIGSQQVQADALGDGAIREIVNQLRDIAVNFHGTQQLRARIASVVVPRLKAVRLVQADAGAVLVSSADLEAINAAMQHLGDVLNGMDAVEAEDEEKTEPGFEAISRILASAPSRPATENDKRDAERFVLLCGALAAELNGEKLSGVHESLRGCLEEMGAPISIDVMREAIDRAAMSRENSEGGEHE